MSPRSIGPALALTLASVLMASSAEAATAFVRVTDPRSPPSYHDEGAGEAHATLGEYFSVRAEAAAYEYVGGVGVFARGDVGETAANLQGQAFAGAEFSDTFTIRSGRMDLGSAFDGLFTVDFAIIPSGSVALNPTPADPAGAYASAGFDYGYSVGGVTGGDRALHTRNPDGSERMFNVNGPPPASVRLSGLQLGSVIPLRLFATAQAEVIAASHRQGFGIAAITDFSHALRWGGVTSISATDSFGNPIDLPAGFELSLIGASGFDYWGAAGSPPPVAGSAPEPGAWALMLVGFWGAGSRLRRRSVIAAA